MFDLSPGEQFELLGLARRTLEFFFQTDSIPDYQPRHSSLQLAAGVFVSLHRGKDLRGCVGHLRADRPLYRSVVELALAAALEDPRFLPLQAEELKELEIEISVLSPFAAVTDLEEIELGKHGLLVSMGSCRGLLLPQVAVQRSWNRARFLEETCLKAGLPRDGWRLGAVIEKFTAQIFREGKPGEYAG
ncbi:MAG: AmmeMemoRadiSam system protein A [Acidobacteria bacterium]|nr:AmmeMemoRadiSam system protein A [Acidobacteriota bacterium]